MIDHLELYSADAARSVAFYRGALGPLGYALRVEAASNGFGTDGADPDFWIRGGAPSTPPPHFAFVCAARAVVDAAHRAALAAGAATTAHPGSSPTSVPATTPVSSTIPTGTTSSSSAAQRFARARWP